MDSFAKIGAYTHIGKHSRVGTFSNIGLRCNIANHVNIGSFVQLANEVVIAADSTLDSYSTVSNGARIAHRVRLNQYAEVGDNARIADDCILNSFSVVGECAELSSKVYVGQYSHVAPYVAVDESAVIHNFVEIEHGGNIGRKQVVIRTPSSFDLYQNCALNVPSEKANAADHRTNGGVSSEFNSMLRQLIETEWNALRANAGQAEVEQTRPATLPEIISLYLIQYHGLQRFNEIKQKVDQISEAHNINMKNGKVGINGKRLIESDDSFSLQLQHEFHLGNDSPNELLELDVKQKFIRLLAIDQDAQRHERVILDTFCDMLQEILSGDRDVTCAKPLNAETIIFH